MMDWYQIISYLFTNELRLLLGLFLVASLTGFSLKKEGCSCLLSPAALSRSYKHFQLQLLAL